MILQCPCHIDNDDIGQKTLFACWFLKIYPSLNPTPTTKDIYYFLKSSGISWNSALNVCQFLTGSKASPYIQQYSTNLPANKFNLSTKDIVHSFAIATAVCQPDKWEQFIQNVENLSGLSREQWINKLEAITS